jgi:hypothetical protein
MGAKRSSSVVRETGTGIRGESAHRKRQRAAPPLGSHDATGLEEERILIPGLGRPREGHGEKEECAPDLFGDDLEIFDMDSDFDHVLYENGGRSPDQNRQPASRPVEAGDAGDGLWDMPSLGDGGNIDATSGMALSVPTPPPCTALPSPATASSSSPTQAPLPSPAHASVPTPALQSMQASSSLVPCPAPEAGPWEPPREEEGRAPLPRGDGEGESRFPCGPGQEQGRAVGGGTGGSESSSHTCASGGQRGDKLPGGWGGIGRAKKPSNGRVSTQDVKAQLRGDPGVIMELYQDGVRFGLGGMAWSSGTRGTAPGPGSSSAPPPGRWYGGQAER